MRNLPPLVEFPGSAGVTPALREYCEQCVSFSQREGDGMAEDQ
jgi:hypothetical protein